MRGLPSVAWTTSDEGQRQCCLDNVRVTPSGPMKEVRWPRQKSPRWSAGRCACRVTAARGHLLGGAQAETLRLTGAPLPHGRKEGNEGGAPRQTFPGPLSHACIDDADVMRLKGAGCLTCESENTGAGRVHRRHS